MICLDTNYLIRALIPGTPDARQVEAWLIEGEKIMIPTVAWYEFLCGCTREEEQLASLLLTGGIHAFTEAEAMEAARLFNAVNRKRSLRVDAMIAGTAITAKARLATNNRADFEPFVAHGLQFQQTSLGG